MMRKKNIIITNNFLPKEQFDALSELITTENFSWCFNKTKIRTEDASISPGQFTHLIYNEDAPVSQFYNDFFIPILRHLECLILARIKANLNHRLPEPFFSDFHIDPYIRDYVSPLTTAILYINTNNGYTEFEDGTKVESVANRLVFFPAPTKHRGVTQTDTQTRILINFNYLKK